ncbi:hypothetical protein Tco_1172794 [Tanacetum coccineum]
MWWWRGFGGDNDDNEDGGGVAVVGEGRQRRWVSGGDREARGGEQSQPLKILGKGEGLPTWPLYSWEGNSRVDEMILARVSSGFAGKKYGRTSKLYLGLLGGKDCFLGKLAEWSPKVV